MRSRSRKTLIRVIVYGSVALFITLLVFLFKGQQRLFDLVSRTSQKTTDVYSAWLTLAPDHALLWDYVLATLDSLGYQAVSSAPVREGQYHADFPKLHIWTRGFHYPDQFLPSQQILLSFWNRRLSKVETLPDGRSAESWRLEPKRLARWAAKTGASQPQLRIEELPRYVRMAVVAIEDKRFFQHGAIDIRGLLRAIWVNIRGGRLRQGGSTISQQLSRSIFLDIKRTWTRKLLEAGLAFFLEAAYSKEKLLEMYLNQVYWGQDGTGTLLGMEAASRSFFGKPARELSIGEAALLAGLLQSPNQYSPRANIKKARSRRNLVLSLMRNQEIISQEQMEAALREPIQLAPVTIRPGEASYFVATLQETLLQKYTLGILLNQGWQIFTTLDPVLQTRAVAALNPAEGQAALVALDPRTGAVRAWVGGTGYGKSTYDRVVYARRQPGSAFKPFVMLAALDTRKATQATILEDKPLTVKTPQGNWLPQNYDRKYREKASVWDALVLSLNVPTVRLAIDTGVEKVAEYARRMGIESPLRPVPSLALGTSEVSVLELTSAYGTFANGGRYAEPYTIDLILDSDRQVVQSHRPQPVQAVPETSAFLVTHMLEAVFDEGTARLARQLGFTYPAAGKTGTSTDYLDAWFIGYSPRLVCGVWVGHDQPRTLGRAAAGIALPIWVSFMRKALAFWPEEKIAEPKGLVWKTMDKESGGLARSGCTERRKQVFLPGTEPEEMCKLHPGGIIGFFYRLKNK